VAHRKAVQRFATASRGTIVLNRLQLIGLPFTNFIPKLRKVNFCGALDKATATSALRKAASLPGATMDLESTTPLNLNGSSTNCFADDFWRTNGHKWT
jgi:hypothetical protein